MLIIQENIPRMTLVGFADKYNLVMLVKEREPDFDPRRRYFAYFADCEVKQGSFLCGMFGDGSTPEEAIADYACCISHKRLVFNADRDNRREITAPILT